MTNQTGQVLSGFEPSIDKPTGGQSPIKHAKWVLDNYIAEEREYPQDGGGTRKSIMVTFNFKDLEIIDSTEPYVLPIAQIRIPFSNPQGTSEKTRWAGLSGSLRTLGIPTLDWLVGKHQEWKQMPHTISGMVNPDAANPRDRFGDIEAEVWKVIAVEGAVATNDELEAELLTLADGKTEAEYYQALTQNPNVLKRPDLVGEITDRTLVGKLLLGGKLVRSAEGVLTKA